MDRARAVRISKLLGLGLRHDPARLRLVLDRAGWADVDAVLRGLASLGEPLDLDELEAIVVGMEKRRYAFSADGTRIRASQGHSVDVELGLAPTEPPDLLFHGTVERFLESILSAGILRGARTHVHLSVDVQTARIVASRRRGAHVILSVRARAMHAAGSSFFLSENGVWLTEHVPPSFVDVYGRAR
ncbi:RNA:NAD 2'-phosphotransferase [Labilithrix luteola]|uniref:Probable RNA 2'-phosphotransferase n=1 Tax=Labilithrix luteola TaxID=1391654 RepID=A0A0K1PZM6_9BACT|nr:RNA 2'-phosphotransferase [Labilithrix luteola]AKU98978.1 RNA:NAD 2'-phosphotransferase [Labilithrix luteola]